MARIARVLLTVFLIASLAAGLMPAAHAEKVTIQLPDYTILNLRGNVVAHLKYVEIDDNRMGSTQTTTPLERVKWFRLFYFYENIGNETADGDLKLVFYDDKGNELKLDERTYTGDTISPMSRSTTKFVELPYTKDSRIVTISVFTGFQQTNFTVPYPGMATPTAMPTATITATAIPTGTPTATPTQGSTSCLPLLPFAILASVGLAGTMASRKINKK